MTTQKQEFHHLVPYTNNYLINQSIALGEDFCGSDRFFGIFLMSAFLWFLFNEKFSQIKFEENFVQHQTEGSLSHTLIM